MFMQLVRLLLSFEGRIPRSSFWAAGLALATSFVLILVFLEAELGRRASLAIYLPYFWCMLALWVKRLHDRGRSPFALVALLIPVLGPLWFMAELGFKRGTVGENQYGADPYDARPDYLTVA